VNGYPAQIVGHREGRERALAAARRLGGPAAGDAAARAGRPAHSSE
jgi:hypothetical protein